MRKRQVIVSTRIPAQEHPAAAWRPHRTAVHRHLVASAATAAAAATAADATATATRAACSAAFAHLRRLRRLRIDIHSRCQLVQVVHILRELDALLDKIIRKAARKRMRRRSQQLLGQDGLIPRGNRTVGDAPCERNRHRLVAQIHQSKIQKRLVTHACDVGAGRLERWQWIVHHPSIGIEHEDVKAA